MSELQDVIDWLKLIPDARAITAHRTLERVANLDMEAAAKAVSIYVHGYELPPDGMRLLEKQLSVGVNAAFGVTTEDDE